MNPMRDAMLACAAMLALMWGVASRAAEPAPAPQQGSASTTPAPSGDAVCTRCHDELETKPILSIYQTKHGVRGDARAPLCQGCHGSSEKHLKNKQVPPDVTFGENKSEVLAQDAVCLSCHRSDRRAGAARAPRRI